MLAEVKNKAAAQEGQAVRHLQVNAAQNLSVTNYDDSCCPWPFKTRDFMRTSTIVNWMKTYNSHQCFIKVSKLFKIEANMVKSTPKYEILHFLLPLGGDMISAEPPNVSWVRLRSRMTLHRVSDYTKWKDVRLQACEMWGRLDDGQCSYYVYLPCDNFWFAEGNPAGLPLAGSQGMLQNREESAS